jgi:hypothetical protein
MNTRFRPGWARALEVLPGYVGGILEWKEAGKTLLAKIETINPYDSSILINFEWTIEKDFKGRCIRQTPENTTAPTTVWTIDTTKEDGDADLDTETRQIIFSMKLLSLHFIMHHPDSEFATTLNVDCLAE